MGSGAAAPQEGVAQPAVAVRALDEARDVGHLDALALAAAERGLSVLIAEVGLFEQVPVPEEELAAGACTSLQTRARHSKSKC